MRTLLQVAEINEPERYRLLDISTEAPFTQSYFYGQWQAGAGHQVKRFVIGDQSRPTGYGQAILYSLSGGRHYWYLPYGPLLSHFDASVRQGLETAARQLASPSSVFVRFDFSLKNSSNIEPLLVAQAGWHKATHQTSTSSLQPRSEWLLNITAPTEELLKAGSYDLRRGLKLAASSGLKAKIITQNLEHYFNQFMDLQQLTAQRNHFRLHEPSYYRQMFKACEEQQNGYLVLIEHDHQPITVIFIIVYGDVANYVFGGSDERYGKLRPTYLAQWQAIGEARQRGSKLYNFGGIYSPLFPRESLKGPTVFKQKFGGFELDHPYLYDYVLKPGWYRSYNLYKNLQQTIRKFKSR